MEAGTFYKNLISITIPLGSYVLNILIFIHPSLKRQRSLLNGFNPDAGKT